ncbi:D-Ala-D-Ala carboxypeptidase family metallohydrolase [Oceanimonas pelagia]|uniref:D-Ala-D-Ala carboxypeptidase family metallohydrolase n=1 Tax=Oceanimonas pelagia TaxID=3028314 RepID=A0AA50KL19_9GAMM|nr:D-Ala-D-Ala carboxypeptidase family metallohydrolase [Oceanimonas pelagia]WMC09494.1 D-Ala-D-Ala carboxypeptidase family metallohydrolase [Oceanimonas pelagia]
MALKYFKREEFACPHCGENHIEQGFVQRLDKARAAAGVPFVINSGYRCKIHNADVGGVESSAHRVGLAADIKTPNSVVRFKILKALLDEGFTRIGVYSEGAGDFIHVDADPRKPAEVCWAK